MQLRPGGLRHACRASHSASSPNTPLTMPNSHDAEQHRLSVVCLLHAKLSTSAADAIHAVVGKSSDAAKVTAGQLMHSLCGGREQLSKRVV